MQFSLPEIQHTADVRLLDLELFFHRSGLP